jgi:putative ABC transport system permease protein
MTDRKMFWRIIRRLLSANPGRLFVMLLALGAGAAITAALLNLQVDAKRRLTKEFRAFGSNVVIAPRDAGSATAGVATLDEAVVKQVPTVSGGQRVTAVSFLYLIVDVHTYTSDRTFPAVVAGRHAETLGDIFPNPTAATAATPPQNESLCEVGTKVAAQANLRVGDKLILRNGPKEETCAMETMVSSGGTEDSQIFLRLGAAQRLAALPGRISLVQLSVTGRPADIENYIADLQKQIPDAEVHGIRQFTEAEGKIYNRISGLLTATVFLVLLLTSLCVMAAMTNVAMERKNDVGLMKALGGSVRRVVRLFLAEAALLGLAGGILGSTAGLLISMWLGKAVFGVAARPRLIVYPVAIVLTVMVSIASAFPLRRLASIRPASVFRGEA